MFETHSLLQLALPRSEAALMRLKQLIWQRLDTPVKVEFAGYQEQHESFDIGRRKKFSTIDLPYSWGKLFDQGWFRLKMGKIPAGAYLRWADQGEGTLYCDGMPWYGFDVMHHYCQLPAGVKEFIVEGLCLQCGIWGPGASGLSAEGSRLSEVALYARDEAVWNLYHDWLVLQDWVLHALQSNDPRNAGHTWAVGYHPPLNEIPVLARRLLRYLDDASIALDNRGVEAAQRVLCEAYREMGQSPAAAKAILTGHAHMDLVWLWPERATTSKILHTFATMNRLAEVYPEFLFNASQTKAYADLAVRNPRLHTAVKDKVRRGRWEALGATYVEGDTNMACGECLARNFLLGQRDFRDLRGKESPLLWLPDVFGYAGCLPQVMKQSGVEFFYTTKLAWSNLNQFPYSSFVWRGTDGSEVVAHISFAGGYNQQATVGNICDAARANRQSDIFPEHLAPTGYGDGGGGTTEEAIERARRLAKLEGMPSAQWGMAEKFFERLAKKKQKLPTYQGELYLEFHRGVLTTHGDLKAAFRAAERGMQVWEAARCATGGGEVDEAIWKRLLLAQFHDYIPGSSIWEVYEETVPELQAIAEAGVHNAINELGTKSEKKEKKATDCVFNPLPIGRVELIGGEPHFIPPLTGVPLAQGALFDLAVVEVSERHISNGPIEAHFTATGEIRKLKIDGCRIAATVPLGQLISYADYPAAFEAWDIDRQTLCSPQPLKTPAKVSIERKGETSASIAFTRKCGTQSSVTTRYRLDSCSSALHIEYEIDWHEENTLLKAHFPTRYAGGNARFGAPFGSTLRPQLPGKMDAEAMFEVPGSRWAIVSDDGEREGLAVITEAKYGFSCRSGDLSVSLVRSPKCSAEREPNGSTHLTPTLRRGGARPLCTDQGRHIVRMALALHNSETSGNLQIPVLADLLFTPCIPYHGTPCSAGLITIEDADPLVPCWAKPAADGRGWLLRLHETLGRRGTANLVLAPGWQATRTDLSEKNASPRPVRKIAFSPYELITLRIQASTNF